MLGRIQASTPYAQQKRIAFGKLSQAQEGYLKEMAEYHDNRVKKINKIMDSDRPLSEASILCHNTERECRKDAADKIRNAIPVLKEMD